VLMPHYLLNQSLCTLQESDSRISMTFDSWTSLTGDPYLSVMAHYISSSVDNPQQWELRCEQLAFAPIHGNHSGSNIAKILIETIDKYGIHKKVN
jgi:hypothetical protein